MNKKTHIIFLDFDDIKNPLLGAGQARATYEVGKRLVKKGYQVTVISSTYPGYKDRYEAGMYFKHIGPSTKNIKLNNILYILSLPFILPKIQADLMVECFTAPISTMFSPLFTKIPVIGLSTMFEAEHFAKVYHLPFHWIERFGVRFYRYFIALSDFYKQKMQRFNPAVYSTVIPEGVDSAYFKVTSKKPKHILFLGRYDIEQKGIDLLLHAYAQVAEKVGMPLVLAGRGSGETKMRDQVKELGISDKVIFAGPAWGKKKLKLLAHAALVALPSRHETFSCFALEALAAGVPIVRFDIPGLAWMDSSVSLKARQFTIKEYADLLVEGVSLKKNKAMRAKTKSFARQFRWEDVADQFAEFFQEVQYREQLRNELTNRVIGMSPKLKGNFYENA